MRACRLYIPAATLLSLLLSWGPAVGQVSNPQVRFVTTDPSGACSPSYITVNTTTKNEMACISGVWASINGGGAGGTVTSVSVVSANGLGGTVATATTTPAITLNTSVNAPVLAGNGTAIASGIDTTGGGLTLPTYAATGSPSAAYGLKVAAPSGGAANHSAMFTNGNVGIGATPTNYRLEVGGPTLIGEFNSQTRPASSAVGGLAVTWNYGAGTADTDLWNIYESAATSFRFMQKTGASTHTDLMTILGAGQVGIGGNLSPATLLNIGTGTPTTSASGIQFGTDSAATLYRSAASTVKTDAGFVAASYATGTNCSSSASPAVCAAAPAGSAVIAAAATNVVVNTTAVTANSQILVTEDQGLGTKLSVTCNTQSLLVLGPPRVTARTAGTSFTVAVDVAPTANPLCFGFQIVN